MLLLFLPLVPITAWCRNVVTNAANLLPYLGVNGTADVDFAFDATVVWAPSLSSDTFCAKTSSGYVLLEDNALWPRKMLANGDVIRAKGRTVRPDNGFVVAHCLTIDLIGRVKPEPPIDVTIDEVLAGKHPYYPIRIRGVVRDVFTDEIDHRFRHVIVSSGEKSIALAFHMEKDSSVPFTNLIGAEIRATGSSSPTESGFRRLSRNWIDIHSISDIEIISPPPKDPFADPPIESIHLNETASIMNLGRHSASGTVIAVWQKLNFAVKTAVGAIVNVSLSEGPPPACGDAVEVAGLPDTDLYRINLRRAIWRKQAGTHRLEPEAPKPADLIAIFKRKGEYEIDPHFHGKAISLRGLVTGIPSDGMNDGIVRLQCGDFSIPVDASATPDAVKSLEIGCEAEISGTCIVKTDSWRPNEPMPRIREVVLVVRTPTDVKVLASPPWWTPGKFAAVAGVLVTVLAVFLLWNIMLKRLADKRGLELASTRILQEESKLKVQERTRIAVELHDTIAQNLTGVSLELDSAEQLARKDLDGMLSHLGMAARTLQSCRNELRNCLWDLRSRALEEDDLNKAIRRTVAPLVSDVNLAIRFNVPRKALADDTALVLMRIVRELVQNAVRHGGASSVKIAGNLDDDTLSFSVRDNGCGFDPDKRPGVLQGHFGLQGIRERMTQFDGVMKIESSPGEGAKVSVALKLKNHQKP